MDRINKVESTLLEKIEENNNNNSSYHSNNSVRSSANSGQTTAEFISFEDFREKYFTTTIVEEFSGPVTRMFRNLIVR